MDRHPVHPGGRGGVGYRSPGQQFRKRGPLRRRKCNILCVLFIANPFVEWGPGDGKQPDGLYVACDPSRWETTSVPPASKDPLGGEGHSLRFPFALAGEHGSQSRRSAGESVTRAAAIAASGSAVPAGAPVPSPSSPWSALPVPAVPMGAAPSAVGIPPRVPALSFSGVLVQTLVQTGEGVAVSPCGLSLASCVPLLDKLGVTGSSPVSPT